MTQEQPHVVRQGGRALIGVTHQPSLCSGDVGVLIVVGGPQYRVGSHRQFVLLARKLAAAGIPVMRFDYSGMGDSDGPPITFENADTDIRAALDHFAETAPAVKRFVLWGLCDGASAALSYAANDPRIAGLVLVNPWVRTEAGLAQSYFDGYYRQRLTSVAFWRKVMTEPATLVTALREFAQNLGKARSAISGGEAATSAAGQGAFLARMLEGWKRFGGRAVVLLSGNDLVAKEYKLLVQRDPAWRAALRHADVETHELPGANHTFSSEAARAWVEQGTLLFVQSISRIERPVRM